MKYLESSQGEKDFFIKQQQFNDFSTAPMGAIGGWNNSLEMPRKHKHQSRIVCPAKQFSKIVGKIDIFKHIEAECVFCQNIFIERLSKVCNLE